MKLVDTPRAEPFDASAFVTYDNEEDSAPTEAELVEDLPERENVPEVPAEKPPHRGKSYLRAEAAPDTSESTSDDGDFGAGIDGPSDPNKSDTGPQTQPATSESAVSSLQQPATAADSGDPQNRTGEDGSGSDERRPRKRRRRGRRRGRRDGSSGGETPDGQSADAPAQQKATDGAGTPASPDSSDESGKAPKNKRRRRRRRRSNKGESGSAGNSSNNES